MEHIVCKQDRQEECGETRMMEIVKNYSKNENLRQSFNELAEKTFGLNFEDWYQNGYWLDKYIPYSVVKDGKVIANVSVNLMDMMWNGTVRHLIQLGTVMTEERYRNQGLIRKLMEEIETDYADVDGMYLFANDSVVEFYPKFGYEKATEYLYSKQINNTATVRIKPASMKHKAEWDELEDAIRKNQFCGQFDMKENIELFMFYVTMFMQDSVYYDELLDAYVIAEMEEDEILIHAVFAEQNIELEDVIRAFGNTIKKVKLGFTPADVSGYEREEVCEDDTTLFVKGNAFADFDKEGIMFPTLSHA